MPSLFEDLLIQGCVESADIMKTGDGFWLVYRSVAAILCAKGIYDVPDCAGDRLACDKFFDDWFLYAVVDRGVPVYSLLKLREQEHDAEDGGLADGDTPGVTVSFIGFGHQCLTDCLSDPSDGNRKKLNVEINRVVGHKGQRHHKALKQYFKDPRGQGSYLVAQLYIRYIAGLASNGRLAVPEHYKTLVQQSQSYKSSAKLARLPGFIDALNQAAGRVVCDHESICFQNPQAPDAYEAAAILATHTANTSLFSFAAEVEYHARFLTPLAKIKIPFFGRSIYDSAIRADMTVGDTEFEGPAPFYRAGSKIVKRQRALHPQEALFKEDSLIKLFA